MTDSATLVGVVALVGMGAVAVAAVVTMGQVAAGRTGRSRGRSRSRWRDATAAVLWIATVVSTVAAVASYLRG